MANTYYFPWVRKGINNKISESDTLGEGEGTVLLRPIVNLTANISAKRADIDTKDDEKKTGEDVLSETKALNVVGPGDILNISSKAIKCIRPAANSDKFPAEYYPYIEFWEPDFAWRFTPASPNANGRLRPWVALVVCETSKCKLLRSSGGADKVTFNIDQNDYCQIFPDKTILDYSAHAQGEKQDKADFCRIVSVTAFKSGSKLKTDTGYSAFLIPTFEVGRLRGLGYDESDLKDIPAQKCAWESSFEAQQSGHKNPLTFPSYMSWEFKTFGHSFEYLVKNLSSFSTSDDAIKVDVTEMGEGLDYALLAGLTDVPNAVPKKETIDMPVALKSVFHKDVPFPDKNEPTEAYLYNQLKDLISMNPVFEENKQLINGSFDDGDDDPTVVPPAYGGKHILATGLEEENKEWFTELNLDINHRAAAGLGKKVVQLHQEDLVNRAWKQVEYVNGINDLINNLRLTYSLDKSVKGRNYPFLSNGEDGAEHDYSIEQLLAKYMLNFQSMRNTKDKDGTSISSLMDDNNIPRSFASASFQKVTDYTSNKVANLDLTKVTEQIAESQIFKPKEATFGLMPTIQELKDFTWTIFDRLVSHTFDDSLGKYLVAKNNEFRLKSKSFAVAGNSFVNYLLFLMEQKKKGMLSGPFAIYKAMEMYVLRGSTNSSCIGYTHSSEAIQELWEQGNSPKLSISNRKADLFGVCDDDYIKIFGTEYPITRLMLDSGDYVYVYSIQKLLELAKTSHLGKILFLKKYIFNYQDNDSYNYNFVSLITPEGGVTMPRFLTVYKGWRGSSPSIYTRDPEACYLPEFYYADYTINLGYTVQANLNYAESLAQNWTNTCLGKSQRSVVSGHVSPKDEYQKAPEELMELYKYYQDTVVNHLLYSPDMVIFNPEEVADITNNIDTVNNLKALCATLGGVNEELKCFFDMKDAVYSLQPYKPYEPAKVDTTVKIQKLQNQLMGTEAYERMVKVAEDYYRNFYGSTELQADFIKSLLTTKFPIMAYPQFPEPTYYYLKSLSDKFVLACLDKLPAETVSLFVNNESFIESFLCGMNTEMGRELLWREYPTDQRGSYFRKFWDNDVDDQSIQLNNYFDIDHLHKWTGKLGSNHMPGKSNLLQFIIKSELVKQYPDTKIYLQKVKKGTDGIELDAEQILKPISQAFLNENTCMVGFRIDILSAIGNPRENEYGYMLMFEQDVENIDYRNPENANTGDFLIKTGVEAVSSVLYGRLVVSLVMNR